MLQLRHPGVYTQELSSAVRTISGAATSVTLFVGPTRSGIDGRAIRIQNFGEFERNFGGLSHTSSLSYSVLHFFANGGSEAFVIRVKSEGAEAAQTALKVDDGAAGKTLTLTALASGKAGGEILVDVDAFGSSGDNKRFNLNVVDRVTGRSERFSSLSMSSSSTRFAPQVVSDESSGSRLVELELAPAAINIGGPKPNGTIYSLGALPTTPMSGDATLTVSIDVQKGDGSGVDAAASVSSLVVKVLPKDAPPPASVNALVARIVSAINTAIAKKMTVDANAARAWKGLAVEGIAAENGTRMRLRTVLVGSEAANSRFNDATVTIADPGSPLPAGTVGALATFGITAQALSVNASRYPLGAAVSGAPLAGTRVGVDGNASGQPSEDDFMEAIRSLATPDPFFNLLCLPDLVRPADGDPMKPQHDNAMIVYAEAARICAEKHAFLIIDPEPDVVDVASAEGWKSSKFPFQSSHAAVYFPNIRVDDPLESGAVRTHPPSGAIAGVFARTDSQYGIWQAPAGTEASLSGVYGPSLVLSDDGHGVLNPLGVNCIRKFPIYGTVNFGSRTVDGSNALASDWKYVPVRRTASYILRSLSEGLRWAVHKPNGEQLWSQLRLNVTAFMHGMFRQGAFKGVSAREAYFVLCDASTTTPDDINLGVVNIQVGFAPLKPAEFVVVSLRQIVQPSV